MIGVIKNLYDRATLSVKTSDGCSDTVGITEGVLQGEKLSPLFFNLYRADIVSFFGSRRTSGVNIDGRKDLNLLLYTDDLIVLANGLADLRRNLGILEDYYRLSGLTITVSKTKVVVFRRGGPLPSRDHDFKLNGCPVGIVPNYDYCAASVAALKIIAKINSDSWSGMKALYSSIVRSTFIHLCDMGIERLGEAGDGTTELRQTALSSSEKLCGIFSEAGD
ncbi:uncharacterized protein [Fopius arisanus]|uniref:Reverse transcriptase domain-containing protein n=1 Tax=Fopius arisanus TaxID=64838 RepID=A0A9R1TQU5_9HYME|nr:PREDICTED: uncharacterized protein LOC105272859 [Fopius arisanus]